MAAHPKQRFLIAARRGSHNIRTLLGLLEASGYDADVCLDLSMLKGLHHPETLAIVLLEESLNPDLMETARTMLSQQPHWSDIPILIILSSNRTNEDKTRLLQDIGASANVTFLDQPVRTFTLKTIADSAVKQRQRQYEVRDLVLELQQAREEAIQASHSKSMFLAAMSHDIRTPLTSIISFSEILLDMVEGDAARHARTINTGAQALIGTLSSVLELAELEGAQRRLDAKPVKLAPIIRRTADLFASIADRRGIQILMEVGRLQNATAYGDEPSVTRILNNLLDNALKYTERGRVEIRLELVDGRLGIHVEDTGVGIAEAKQAEVFLPFQQAEGDSAYRRRSSGSGLGLAIARQLSLLMGGDLTLKSKVGSGSTFSLWLQATEATTTEAALPAPERNGHRNGTKRVAEPENVDAGDQQVRLLVIEDNENTRRIMEIFLRQKYEVRLAADPEEAMAVLDGDFEPDIILMDINIDRNVSGIDLMKQLREQEITPPHTVFIAFTAYSLPGDRDNLIKAGFDRYLGKPFTRNDLMEILDDASGQAVAADSN